MNDQLNDLIPAFDLEDLQETEIVETQEKGEVKTPETNTTQKTEPSYTEDADQNAITFYDALKERGYINPTNDFKGTWEEVDKYIETLPQQVLNTVIEQAPDITKQVLKFVFASDKNIDKSELKTFVETYLTELEAVKISTMDDARSFLEKEYASQGMRPSAIKAQLDDLEDEEKLMEEAKKLFEKQSKTTDSIIKSKEAINNEAKVKQAEFVKNITDEIVNTGWQKTKQNEIIQLFKTNAITSKLQDIYKNPKALVQLANIVSLYDGKTINLDFIEKQAQSKITNGVKAAFEKATSSIPATKASSKTPTEIDLNNLSPIID